MQTFHYIFCICAALSLPLSQALPGHRIIGGTAVRPGEYPFIVALYIDANDGTYFCGATLISNQWVLTSASCVQNANVFTLQLGSVTLVDNDPNRLTVATVNAVPHPRYNPTTHDNDIALIKLHLPIEFNDHIKPIGLPAYPIADDILTAIGWGQIGDWGTGVVNNLQAVDLVAITTEECKRIYGEQITDSMICANGNYNEGICTGDNGGPLIQKSVSGASIHAGVSSFVSSNGCETVEPSGFTRTYNYVEWIRDVTKIP